MINNSANFFLLLFKYYKIMAGSIFLGIVLGLISSFLVPIYYHSKFSIHLAKTERVSINDNNELTSGLLSALNSRKYVDFVAETFYSYLDDPFFKSNYSEENISNLRNLLPMSPSSKAQYEEFAKYLSNNAASFIKSPIRVPRYGFLVYFNNQSQSLNIHVSLKNKGCATAFVDAFSHALGRGAIFFNALQDDLERERIEAAHIRIESSFRRLNRAYVANQHKQYSIQSDNFTQVNALLFEILDALSIRGNYSKFQEAIQIQMVSFNENLFPLLKNILNKIHQDKVISQEKYNSYFSKIKNWEHQTVLSSIELKLQENWLTISHRALTDYYLSSSKNPFVSDRLPQLDLTTIDSQLKNPYFLDVRQRNHLTWAFIGVFIGALGGILLVYLKILPKQKFTANKLQIKQFFKFFYSFLN